MPRKFISDEAVELEIERLKESEYVKLSRREQRLRYKRRQFLYQLRAHEKRGKQLADEGYTLDNLELLLAETELEVDVDNDT